MIRAIGFLELCIFLYFAQKSLKDQNRIINNVIYSYLIEILNYKLFGSVPWISVGINLYANDFTVILLLMIIIHNKWFSIHKRQHSLWFSVFILMVVQSCIRGIVSFGFSSDFFADLRKYLYFGVAVVFFSSVNFTNEWIYYKRKLDKLFWFLTIYTGVLLLFYFMGMPLGTRGAERPLLADYAIIYAAYTAVKWYEDLIVSEKPKITLSTLVFTVTLILNRFNTTWVALAVAILILALFRWVDINSEKIGIKTVGQIALIVVVALLFIRFMSNSVVFSKLTSSLDKFNLSEDNTFTSRLEFWSSMMATATGIYAVIGYPFGNGFYVNYRGGIWQTIPHNGYIETLLRTGYVGVIALVISMIVLFINAMRKKNILIVMLCAICMVYWYAYQLTFEQGIIIGLCVQMAYRRSSYENEAGIRIQI